MTFRSPFVLLPLLLPLLGGCETSRSDRSDAADSVRTRRQALFAALGNQDTTALDTLLRGADSLTATTWRNPASQAWLNGDAGLFLWLDRHDLSFQREAFRFDSLGHLWFVGAGLAGQRPVGPQRGDTYGMALPGPAVHSAWTRWIASRPATARPWGAAVADWDAVVLEPSGIVVKPCSMAQVVATRVLEAPPRGYEVACESAPSSGTGLGQGQPMVVRLDSIGTVLGSSPARPDPSTRLPPGFSPASSAFQDHLDSLRMGGATVPAWAGVSARRCRSDAYANAFLRGDTAAMTRLLPDEPNGNCLARAELDPVAGCPTNDAMCDTTRLEWTAGVAQFLGAISRPVPGTPEEEARDRLSATPRTRRALDSAFARAYPILGAWFGNHPERLTAP